MQCAERRQGDLRCADLQTGAVDRVELPRRQNRHGAGRQLHVHQLTRCAPLALNTTHPPSVQRMPAIVDHNILPDMGRMTEIALNRKNALFAGHDQGVENWAASPHLSRPARDVAAAGC